MIIRTFGRIHFETDDRAVDAGTYGPPGQAHYVHADIYGSDDTVVRGRLHWAYGGGVRLTTDAGEPIDVPADLTVDAVRELFKDIEHRLQWEAEADPANWVGPCRCWPTQSPCHHCDHAGLVLLSRATQDAVTAHGHRRDAALGSLRDLVDRFREAAEDQTDGLDRTGLIHDLEDLEDAPTEWIEEGLAAYRAWAQRRAEAGVPADADDWYGVEACHTILTAVLTAGRRIPAGTVTVTRGLPGSGKTTYARGQVTTSSRRLARLNLDDFRTMMFNGRSGWREREAAAVTARNAAFRALLDAGWNVICDDTNLPDIRIQEFRTIAGAHGAAVNIVDLRDVPLEDCLRRNDERTGPARIDSEVIHRMYREHIAPRPSPENDRV